MDLHNLSHLNEYREAPEIDFRKLYDYPFSPSGPRSSMRERPCVF